MRMSMTTEEWRLVVDRGDPTRRLGHRGPDMVTLQPPQDSGELDSRVVEPGDQPAGALGALEHPGFEDEAHCPGRFNVRHRPVPPRSSAGYQTSQAPTMRIRYRRSKAATMLLSRTSPHATKSGISLSGTHSIRLDSCASVGSPMNSAWSVQ